MTSLNLSKQFNAFKINKNIFIFKNLFKIFIYFLIMSESEDSVYNEEGWISWFCGLEDHHFFC